MGDAVAVALSYFIDVCVLNVINVCMSEIEFASPVSVRGRGKEWKVLCLA